MHMVRTAIIASLTMGAIVCGVLNWTDFTTVHYKRDGVGHVIGMFLLERV